MSLRWLWLKILRFWKNTLPDTLFGRSMLILVMPVVLTLAIGLFIFFDRHWSTMTTRLTASLAGEVAMVTDSWERDPSEESRKHLKDLTQNFLGLHFNYNKEATLPKTKTHLLPAVTNPLKAALEETLKVPFALTTYKDNSSWVIVYVTVPDGVLKFYVPEKRLFSTTTYVFLLFMLGSGLILSVIAVVFMRNQIRPVRKLAIVAEQFGKGIDTPRFRPSGAREVRQAAQAFLDMRDRIKKQMRQRTDMLSGVSHDLRTPLTRMRLQLAMLPKNADTEAMQHDIVVMEKMIKGYLDFARGEALENAYRCDIGDLLTQCIGDARRQGAQVICDLPDQPAYAVVRPQAIQRAFGNILENARLYASDIWVTVNILSRNVEIIFDDNGPGIPEHARETVFKPFQRVDESRNQDIEGTGLGLTIALDIVQTHGGTITLGTAPQGGLRATILLPF